MMNKLPRFTRHLKRCGAYTLLFGLLLYGQRAMTLGFSMDSMLIWSGGMEQYQISLGRFLQPLWWMIRGLLTPPPVIIGLMLVAVWLSTAMTAELFCLEKPFEQMVLCAIMVGTEAMISSVATYLPWVDVYGMALVLAVAGVYVTIRVPKGLFIAPLLYALSLGFYQSYLQVAVMLLMSLLLLRICEGEDARTLLMTGLGYVASLVAGMVLYALLLKAVLLLSGTAASNDYNGVGTLSGITLSVIPELVREAYLEPFRFLMGHTKWDTTLIVPAGFNILSVATALICIGVGLRDKGPAHWALAVLVIALMPLGMNFVEILSQGIIHRLMEYSYCVVKILALALLVRTLPECRVQRLLMVPMLISFALCVAGSDRMMLKRDAEYAATESIMARVLDRAEQTEGYKPGETPVVVCGELAGSHVFMRRPGFDTISDWQGMRNTFSVAYEQAAYWYFPQVSGVRMNLVSYEESLELLSQGIARGMASFPAEGCIEMCEGYLVIHF